MTRSELPLFWTPLQQYETCPQLFLWRNGWDGIDLGEGLGKRKIAQKQRSSHDAVMGTVIGATIEDLYNMELWKLPQATLTVDLERRIRYKFELELNEPGRFIDWNQAPSQGAMLQVCRDGVFGYLKTMRQHKLLGIWARAEYPFRGNIDPHTMFGGKSDIVFRRDSDDKDLPGITILDGKNSAKKENSWNSDDQVRWYALCFWLKYGFLPDRLGFVYFRHPYGNPEVDPKTGHPIVGSKNVEQGVKWVPFDKERLVALAKRGKAAKEGMRSLNFDPKPQPKHCRYCDYESECPARTVQKAANSAKRSKSKPPDLEGFVKGSDGFEEIG